MIKFNCGKEELNFEIENGHHIAIYSIDLEYEPRQNDHEMRKIAKATPKIMYPVYGKDDEEINLRSIVESDIISGVLDVSKRKYWVMEEDEDDNVLELICMIYTSAPDPIKVPKFIFDCCEWDARVEATNAFDKDFVYPISENRDEEVDYDG